jgi:hypothetical protein
MEDEYLKGIWNSHNNEIETFLDMNDQSIETIQIKKAKSKLRSLLFPKIIGIVLGLGWISFMFMLIYFCVIYTPMSVGKFFFVGSISMILLSTSFAVFLYVKDILTVIQIDNSDSVTITQRKLATLQFSIMKSVRIIWLQLPFYTTWYLNYELIVHGSIIFWIVQIFFTGLTTWLAIWLFRKINYTNVNKTRFRNFMRGYGFYSVIQALDFIKEIDNFKNDR